MGMLLNAILLAVIAALYAVLPLSIDPVAVEWARNPSTSGPFQPNDAFKKVKLIGKGKIFGPETVVFNKEGELFGFTEFGSVVQIFEEEDRVVEWAHIGGRPISGVFDQNGDLIVCDVTKGLLKANKNTKEVSLLTARTDDGIPLTFIDDVDIGPDGKIYFSDATVFSPQRKRDGTYNLMDTSVLELLEGQKTGRLVEYDPVSKTTTTLMSGLYFANGIAVSQKGDYVLINETLAKRTHRYWLQGPKKGTHELFMDTVPGFVDGISRRPNGNYWVAVPKIESDPTLQFIASRPWLKAFLAKVLLPVILSVQKHVAIIYEVSPEGEVLGGLFDMKGEMIHGITSVTEHNGKLYLGSFNDFLGVYDLSS